MKLRGKKNVWCILATLMFQIANKEILISLMESFKKQYKIEWKVQKLFLLVLFSSGSKADYSIINIR